MYQGSEKTRNVACESSNFCCEGYTKDLRWAHPYLFFILMDVFTKKVIKYASESMMFVDDIVLCGGKIEGRHDKVPGGTHWKKEDWVLNSRPKTQITDLNSKWMKR